MNSIPQLVFVRVTKGEGGHIRRGEGRKDRAGKALQNSATCHPVATKKPINLRKDQRDCRCHAHKSCARSERKSGGGLLGGDRRLLSLFRLSRSLFRLPNIPMVLGQGLLCCKAFVTMSASVLLEFDVHVVYMVMVCTPPIPTCFICSASMEPAVLLGLHCDNLVFKKHVESF